LLLLLLLLLLGVRLLVLLLLLLLARMQLLQLLVLLNQPRLQQLLCSQPALQARVTSSTARSIARSTCCFLAAGAAADRCCWCGFGRGTC
jgi:hypothetical protein